MGPKLLCAAILLAAGWSGAAFAASEEAEVMQPIHRFFEAFAKRDKAGMLAEVAPGLEVTSERDGELHRLGIEALADRIVAFQGGAIAETVRDPIIHVDGALAVVWAPFTFSIDGKPDHCGIDLVTLYKLQGRWRIAGLADNRHEKC
jgi:hypothetical protein